METEVLRTSLSSPSTETTQLLQDIASKLEIIQITLKDFVDTYKSDKSESAEIMLCLEEKINSISEQMINKESSESRIEDEVNHVEDTALSVKNSIFRIWRKSLNERKMSYWNHLRFLRTAVTYDKWLGKATPVLPRKFRPLSIPGEAEEDKAIRRELALKTYESEIRILKNKAKRCEESFTKIDTEMMQIIANKSSDETCESLIQLWKQDCEKEEEKSGRIWQKSQSWFDAYENNFGSNIFMTDKGRTNGQGSKIENSRINSRDNQDNDNYSNERNGVFVPPRRKQRGRQDNAERRYTNKPYHFTTDNTNRRNSKPINHEGTTYIGTNVRSSFLGGGRHNTDKRNRENREQTFVKQVY